MIKILWNQCECETQVPDYSYASMQALTGGARHTVAARCGDAGSERTFDDGETAMSDNQAVG